MTGNYLTGTMPTQLGMLTRHALCGLSPIPESATYTDSYGYTCAQWAGYCSVTHWSYISACPTDDLPEPPCEVGGYHSSTGYYSAANMDGLRQNCPITCGPSRFGCGVDALCVHPSPFIPSPFAQFIVHRARADAARELSKRRRGGGSSAGQSGRTSSREPCPPSSVLGQ